MWYIPFPLRYPFKMYFFRQFIDSFLYTGSLITSSIKPIDDHTGYIDNINTDILITPDLNTLSSNIKNKDHDLMKLKHVIPIV